MRMSAGRVSASETKLVGTIRAAKLTAAKKFRGGARGSMKHLVLALSLCVAAGGWSPAFAGGIQDNAKIIAIAKSMIDTVVAEDFCAVRERFDAKLKSSLTTDKMQEGWAVMAAQVGKFKNVSGTEVMNTPEGNYLVILRLVFEKGAGTARILFDRDDTVVGLLVSPGVEFGAATSQTGTAAEGQPSESQSGGAAKQVVALLEAQKFSEAWELFSPQMKEQMSVDKLRSLWASVMQNVGGYRRITNSTYFKVSGHDAWDMRCAFERGFVMIRVVFDGQQKIVGLHFAPTP